MILVRRRNSNSGLIGEGEMEIDAEIDASKDEKQSDANNLPIQNPSFLTTTPIEQSNTKSNTRQIDTQSDFEAAQITQTDETVQEVKDETAVKTMKDLEDIEAMWAA